MCRRNNPLFHSCYKRPLIVKGPCRDPGIFFPGGGGGGGGGGLRSIWYINYPFPRFQKRSNIFRGGSNFFQRRGVVSNCLFPIETHITCDFPVSPSGSAHEDTTIRGLRLNLPPPPPRSWSYLSFKTVKVH